MRNITDKLLSRGVEVLTDAELLAVVVAESTSDERAVAMAQELLRLNGGSLVALIDGDVARLRMSAGIGLRRAMLLKVSQELGRRVAVARAAAVEQYISSDTDVVRLMEPMLGCLKHEECWALYLASSGKVLERVRISQGGVQATVVDCKLILKRALELLAVEVVLVHNHPSGKASPSPQDRELTQRVDEGCRLFEIRLLDHVIIAHGDHYSFRAHNLLK